MAISVNWNSRIIVVPQNYLTNLGNDIYELDVNQFRLDLKDLEDSEDGMQFPSTHQHNTQVLLSGSVYARTFEIINGYKVQFEQGFYTVKCTGANHNIGDVKVVNSVSLIINNSAGLIVSGSGVLPGDITSIINGVWNSQLEGAITAVQLMRLFAAILAGKTTVVDLGGGNATVTFRDINDTVDRVEADMTGCERADITLNLNP